MRLLLAGCCVLTAIPAAADAPRPIRVVVAALASEQTALVERLRQQKFDAVLTPWRKVQPAAMKESEVVLLPTGWAQNLEAYNHFEEKKDAFHKFVERGGGLVICQPNPFPRRTCTPALLPYSITFQSSYDESKPKRVNLRQEHFITEDLPDTAMPFPADPMLELDPRYTVLASQVSTRWASLAVCRFGDGRVVVQTANENLGATIPLNPEVLRRMIVWAAGKDEQELKRR